MQPVAILMSVFAVVLLLFAALVYSGDTGLIRTMRFVKVKDKKEYARFLGRSLAAAALILIVGALLSLVMKLTVALFLTLVLLILALAIIAGRSSKYFK